MSDTFSFRIPGVNIAITEKIKRLFSAEAHEGEKQDQAIGMPLLLDYEDSWRRLCQTNRQLCKQMEGTSKRYNDFLFQCQREISTWNTLLKDFALIPSLQVSIINITSKIESLNSSLSYFEKIYSTLLSIKQDSIIKGMKEKTEARVLQVQKRHEAKVVNLKSVLIEENKMKKESQKRKQNEEFKAELFHAKISEEIDNHELSATQSIEDDAVLRQFYADVEELP